jgi:hypothetical protein
VSPIGWTRSQRERKPFMLSVYVSSQGTEQEWGRVDRKQLFSTFSLVTWSSFAVI